MQYSERRRSPAATSFIHFKDSSMLTSIILSEPIRPLSRTHLSLRADSNCNNATTRR